MDFQTFKKPFPKFLFKYVVKTPVAIILATLLTFGLLFLLAYSNYYNITCISEARLDGHGMYSAEVNAEFKPFIEKEMKLVWYEEKDGNRYLTPITKIVTSSENNRIKLFFKAEGTSGHVIFAEIPVGRDRVIKKMISRKKGENQ